MGDGPARLAVRHAAGAEPALDRLRVHVACSRELPRRVAALQHDRSQSLVHAISSRDVFGHVKDSAGPIWLSYRGGMLRLVLWDVDHTLIENAGVSKAIYADAFQQLTGTSSRRTRR